MMPFVAVAFHGFINFPRCLKIQAMQAAFECFRVRPVQTNIDHAETDFGCRKEKTLFGGVKREGVLRPDKLPGRSWAIAVQAGGHIHRNNPVLSVQQVYQIGSGPFRSACQSRAEQGINPKGVFIVFRQLAGWWLQQCIGSEAEQTGGIGFIVCAVACRLDAVAKGVTEPLSEQHTGHRQPVSAVVATAAHNAKPCVAGILFQNSLQTKSGSAFHQLQAADRLMRDGIFIGHFLLPGTENFHANTLRLARSTTTQISPETSPQGSPSVCKAIGSLRCSLKCCASVRRTPG